MTRLSPTPPAIPRFLPALALTLALTLPAQADWPQFLGPTRDGHTTEAVGGDWPKGGPAVAWSKDLGSGWAGPVVAGGRAFAFHRVGGDEVLEAVDPATGKGLWRAAARTRYRDDFGFDDGPRATPLVADGRVFTLGADGDLRAASAADGAQLWHVNVRTTYAAPKGFFGIACSPVIAGGRLLVNVGGKGAGVVAFDPATGKEAWRATDDAASYSSPAVATVGGKATALFLTRAGLVGLDPDAGRVRFAHPFRARLNESVNAATPLAWNDEIFLTTSYGVGGALLRVKGDELDEVWANDRSIAAHYNTPVRVGDFLYGIDGRQEGGAARLRCVEWKTGAVRWSVPNFGCATLIAGDGGGRAVAGGGGLVRVSASPDKFTETGRAAILDSPTRAAPALADGRLFARDGKKLVCVRLR